MADNELLQGNLSDVLERKKLDVTAEGEKRTQLIQRLQDDCNEFVGLCAQSEINTDTVLEEGKAWAIRGWSLGKINQYDHLVTDAHDGDAMGYEEIIISKYSRLYVVPYKFHMNKLFHMMELLVTPNFKAEGHPADWVFDPKDLKTQEIDEMDAKLRSGIIDFFEKRSQ